MRKLNLEEQSLCWEKIIQQREREKIKLNLRIKQVEKTRLILTSQ